MTVQALRPRRRFAGAGPGSAWRGRALLDLDPDLGAALAPERVAAAREELRVRVAALPGVAGPRHGRPPSSRARSGC